MIRRRAPGGGRKPSPRTPRAQLTVRMPDDLRDELEAAAQKRGSSLTHELLARLRLSLSKEREQQRDPALRALNFVIAQLAERMSGGRYVADRGARLELQKHWRTDPFKFAAFKFAVGKLLDALEPSERDYSGGLSKGEGEAIKKKAQEEVDKEMSEKFGPELSKLIIETNKTPEAYGAFAFASLWDQLTRTIPLTEKEKELGRKYPRFGEEIEHEFYGLEKARRDLGIG